MDLLCINCVGTGEREEREVGTSSMGRGDVKI